MPTSKVIRLERLYSDTVYKPDSGQLQLPIRAADQSVSTILAALRELVPDDVA